LLSINCALTTRLLSFVSNTHLFYFSGKHPYIEAVHDLKNICIERFMKPWLLLDFIFWRTDYGKRFKKAADVVHRYAEQVSELQSIIRNQL